MPYNSELSTLPRDPLFVRYGMPEPMPPERLAFRFAALTSYVDEATSQYDLNADA
jgi:hypothetical protein